jgi:GntR family transcriptional regulator
MRVWPAAYGKSRGKYNDQVLDHDSPVPLHAQLAQTLRDQIASGELAGRVPSIVTLTQQYEVSTRTAARALTTLRDEGLLVSVHGKGYYVVGRS